MRRCLEKNPEQRFQSARDLSFALGALSGRRRTARPEHGASSIPAHADAALARRPLALVAVAGVTWCLARRPAPTTRMQFAFAVPDEMSISHMALSRDGSMLVFVSPEEKSALPMLFVQRVGIAERYASAGNARGELSVLVARRQRMWDFLRTANFIKMAVAGGTPQASGDALSRAAAALGRQRRDPLFAGHA